MGDKRTRKGKRGREIWRGKDRERKNKRVVRERNKIKIMVSPIVTSIDSS